MADNWQDATCQQARLIAGRLNELLSTGLDLLHSELGVDFGVKPEIPPWLIFLAACIGLVLMVAMWASACRGLFKKRPTIIEVETMESTKPAPIKTAKAEEPKKKKGKPTDKKSQPNGSAVAELQEEVRVTEDNLPVVPHSQVKTEKASEVKNTKKKQKRAVKEAKTASSHGKESEEVSGTWETKVSNKEKREQRRKDKTTSDGSGSPGGVDPLPSTPPTVSTKASPKAAAPGSGSEKKEKKKKKGESSKTKAEKADAVAAVAVVRPQAISGEEAPVVTGEWTDRAVTAPALTIVPDEEHWTTSEGNQDTAVWGHETETVEPQLPSPSQPEPQVEDEWSGLSGDGSAAAADGCSDWNAPAEVWGNYEELPALEEPLPETVKVSDEERDKAEPAADGTGKSKKKKKKKQQAEDAVVTGQESEEPSKKVIAEAKVKKQPIQEPAAPAVNATALTARVEQPVVVQNTAPITQVPPQPAETEPTAKQNSLPAPTHKKPEESQPSKPVKKKRARRET
ncbi:protein LYRIC isoform X3 [Salmo trutta]|uniref:protein LYRIC isoform X3 n=1 Tax=Salmo trutta TaxID=8032 RepID=UPI00113063A7|nr:protein LYRIC-like isoform X3 [Salmo trutta]